MIIGTSIVNRSAYVNCRLPQALKDQFVELAKAKGKSASAHLLELILKEFERESIPIGPNCSPDPIITETITNLEN